MNFSLRRIYLTFTLVVLGTQLFDAVLRNNPDTYIASFHILIMILLSISNLAMVAISFISFLMFISESYYYSDMKNEYKLNIKFSCLITIPIFIFLIWFVPDRESFYFSVLYTILLLGNILLEFIFFYKKGLYEKEYQ